MVDVFSYDQQKQKLSAEEKQEKRSELLNRQQLEQAKLDRQLAEEEGHIKTGALKDWEVEFARAKLALKEKHYKVRSRDAIRHTSDRHHHLVKCFNFLVRYRGLRMWNSSLYN